MYSALIQPFNVMIHPIQKTTELKENKNYSILLAILIVFLFFMSDVIEYQYTSRNFNFNKPFTLNVFYVSIRTIFVYFLFVLSNWCVTTLMEGKGTFTEIFVFSSYSIVPIILTSISATLISYFVTQEEAVFMMWIKNIGVIWSAILFLITLMTIHQYSLFRTLISLLLTAFGMLVMVFLIILFFSLMQQMFSFFQTLYYELYYRIV